MFVWSRPDVAAISKSTSLVFSFLFLIFYYLKQTFLMFVWSRPNLSAIIEPTWFKFIFIFLLNKHFFGYLLSTASKMTAGKAEENTGKKEKQTLLALSMASNMTAAERRLKKT
jgi:hypothetical protein